MRRNNPFAYVGILLALISLLINPFALPSVLATIFSSIGLARSLQLDPAVRYTGRVTSILGIILGLLGVAFFVSAWLRLMGSTG